MSEALNDEPSDAMPEDLDEELEKVASNLRQMANTLPGPVRHRVINALNHFDRALAILDVDREMASFRAITGQEEAATALMHAVALRRYPNSARFNPRSHQHKAAVLACVIAIRNDIGPVLLKNFHLTFNFERKRIDLMVPISNFGIVNDDNLMLQPVEPLDIIQTKPGVSEGRQFEQSLTNLAKRSNFDNLKKFVAAQANARNTLLYASDSALPESNAKRTDIKARWRGGLVMLTVAIMVLQSRRHQALVNEAISAFLGVIDKLPKEDGV